MGQLLPILPILNMAVDIEENFKKIAGILNQTSQLSLEQPEVIERISALCMLIQGSV